MNWQETLELHLLHAITIYNYCQVVRITWNATKQHLRQKALCSHQAGAILPTIAYVYILDESAASQAGQKQQKASWNRVDVLATIHLVLPPSLQPGSSLQGDPPG